MLTRWILLLLACLLLCQYGNGQIRTYEDEDDDEEIASNVQPVFTSKPKNITINAGETFKLPCEGENFGHVVRMWYLDKKLLSAGDSLTTNDPRVNVTGESSAIIVTNATVNDAGTYHCVITTSDMNRITHIVRVRDYQSTQQDSLPGMAAANKESQTDGGEDMRPKALTVFIASIIAISYYC